MGSELEKKNYDFCMETIALKSAIEGSFLELGKRLFTIREKEMYLPSYETFEEFSLELKMSRATVSKLVNIYQLFVLKFGIPETRLLQAGGWSNVAELLPVVNTKAQAIKWLEKAEALTRADLRIALTTKKTGIDPADCEHDKDFFVLKICRTCGLKQSIKEKGKK